MRLTSQVVITTQMSKAIENLEQLRTDESIVEIIIPSLATDSEEGIPTQAYIHRIITDKVSFSVSDAKLGHRKSLYGK